MGLQLPGKFISYFPSEKKGVLFYLLIYYINRPCAYRAFLGFSIYTSNARASCWDTQHLDENNFNINDLPFLPVA